MFTGNQQHQTFDIALINQTEATSFEQQPDDYVDEATRAARDLICSSAPLIGSQLRCGIVISSRPPQAEADLHEVVEALTRWRNTPVSKRDTVTLPSSLEMEVELTSDRSMGGVEELVEG